MTDEQLEAINGMLLQWITSGESTIRGPLGDLLTEMGLIPLADYFCWDLDSAGRPFPPRGGDLSRKAPHTRESLIHFANTAAYYLRRTVGKKLEHTLYPNFVIDQNDIAW